MTIEKAIKEVEDRITKALLELGDSVFARSQALVPVQTGELKRSGSSGIYGTTSELNTQHHMLLT